jgi:predicted enzyme related to lactoylglutathione lyase
VALRMQCVVVDSHDPATLAGFWAEVLGWRVTYQDSHQSVVEPPEGSPAVDVSPDLLFSKNPDRKEVKNRLHLDLRPDDQEAELERLFRLGATRASIGQGNDVAWIVLRDPEGNEFCLLPPLQPENDR